MSTKECCRNCKHCLSCQGTSGSWCRLRQIKVHSDIAPVAVCHHWTKRAPSLPKLEEKASEVCMDRQLELGRELVSLEN